MHCKKACLVINPRAGENVAKLSDVIAVLSAAGWSTDIAIKEYGGHTLELATRAARERYDLVLAYGGDGTLNQVVNGVMNAKGQHSIVGVIPGGTANVWAGELGVPIDPVKAALTLVNSEARRVDIGHIEVEGLTFPSPTQNGDVEAARTVQFIVPKQARKARTTKLKATSKARHHFLLMAGLGIDAAVMGHVSRPLKYKIGPLAVGVSALKELPEQHRFPVEIRAMGEAHKGEVLWKGEAIQMVIGNTRKYADIVQMTPNAYIDDGILDVCVITAGNPLTTIQQITSLLLRRKPDNLTTEYFHGAHLSISVPASIHMQLDGSTVKLKDYLSKSDWQALQETGDAEHVMVNYRFDAMPQALRVAIPRTYNDTLFEHEHSNGKSYAEPNQQPDQEKAVTASGEQADGEQSQPEAQHQQSNKELYQHNGNQLEPAQLVTKLLEQGRKVTVVGVSPHPDKKQTFIIAGGSPKRSTGETRPVAVRIGKNTTILRTTGEIAPPATIEKLQEGTEIVVDGKKTKRGVIPARRVVV